MHNPTNAGVSGTKYTLEQCPQCGYNATQGALSNGLATERVTHLTGCNDSPTDEERIRLESIAKDGDAYISRLQHRITTTRATLQLLLDEEVRATQEISRSKTFLNPVRRLPTEILATIFAYSSEPDHSTFLVNGLEQQDEYDYALDSLDPDNMPWVLTYVCSQWRRVAINTSELWTHLRLQFDLYDDHLRYLGALVKYLSRAGSRGIQVHLESSRDISQNPLLIVLMASSYRWVDICISIPFSSVLALNAVHGTLPNLRSVGIQITELPQDGGSLVDWKAFQFAPNLASLTVNGSEGMRWADLPFPWKNISYLDVMGQIHHCVSLVSIADSLEACTLGISISDDSHFGDEQGDVQVHDSLTSLDLTSSNPWQPDTISTFFEHFEFPALIYLRIDFYCYDEFTDVLVPSFTPRTAPSLVELRLDCLDGNFDDDTVARICELLKNTPALTDLHIAALITSDSIFMELGRRNADKDHVLVPELDALDLGKSSITWGGMEANFVYMLESRCAEAKTPLSFLRLASEPEWESTGGFQRRWSSLMNEKGLEVEIVEHERES